MQARASIRMTVGSVGALAMLVHMIGCAQPTGNNSTPVSPAPATAPPPSGGSSSGSNASGAVLTPLPPAACHSGESAVASSIFLYLGLNTQQSWYPDIEIHPLGYVSPPPAITGFAVGDDGSLQSLTGFPCSGSAADMAVNPATRTLYLAGGGEIASYSVANDGSIALSGTITAPQYDPSYFSPGGYYGISVDPAGQTLLASIYYGAGHSKNQQLTVSADGSVIDRGIIRSGVTAQKFYFTPNSSLAYNAFCYHFMADLYGYSRNSDGTFSSFATQAQMPGDLNMPGDIGCPVAMAVSPNGQFLAAYFDTELSQSSNAWLGIFSINADGTLSPLPGSPWRQAQFGSDLVWDSSGEYLIAAEHDGIHVYTLAAGAALTQVAGPIGNVEIEHVLFDQAKHLLFATSASAQSIYVFTWNNGTLTLSAGSPHTVPGQAEEMAIIE